MTIQSTRVLVVDDHEMVRRGISRFLGQTADVVIVGESGRGADAPELARRLRPNVILMDMVMPDLDGAAAIQATRAAAPDAHIIALTSSHSDDLVMQALRAGAIGYLEKSVSARGLADAIRAANAGQPTLTGEAARAVLRLTSEPEEQPPVEHLTAREHEVLELMARGLTNPQIAGQLVVSRATVNFYVSRILGKLGVQSRSAAVALALRSGLVGYDDRAA
jgi:NarL family two-component system response regulator LiaR